MKPCAGCTLCCELMPVLEIRLPPFTPCPHLHPPYAAQLGCSIYRNRPHSCRDWSCLFRQDNDWDEELRPSRCGVVFDEIPDVIKLGGVEYPCIQAWVRPGTPQGFWTEQPILAVVLATLDKGMTMLFRLGPKSTFAVWRGADGTTCSNEHSPVAPETKEPDSIRLRRAAKLAAERGL